MNDINKIKNNAHAKFMAKDNLIGRHKYNMLKLKKNLTQDELLQIEVFENKGKKPLTKEQADIIIDYYKRVYDAEPKKKIELSSDILIDHFKKSFQKLEKREFVETENSILNLQLLAYYFAKDDRFFKCGNLYREINFDGHVKYSDPSFEKGLLIIGGYGCGKSSSIYTFQRMFSRLDDYKFRRLPAMQVVDMFEACDGPEERSSFWSKMIKSETYFDDVKTEDIASNYGKVNLFKDIIEKRYNNRLKTHITCNYKEKFQGNLQEALLEFGEMYGSRVFDRLFEMFNIIEFKGKSFRR